MTDLVSGLVLTLISLAVIGGGFYLGEKFRREEARRKEAIHKLIAKHERALAKKRRQLVQRDAYGNEKIQTWNKEKKYFIDTVLIPHLTGLGHYDKEEQNEVVSDELREALLGKEELKEIDEAIEDAARRGLARLPASNAITDITTGHEYEHFCAGLLSESGWDTRLTKASGDQGVDIIAHYDGLTVVFQCKFYTHPVGNKAVQEAVAARIHEQADLAVVISNATYTKSVEALAGTAEALAGTTETILINHDDIPALKEIIRRKVGSEAASQMAPKVAGSLSDEELGQQLASTYHARRRGERTDDR